MSNSSKEKKNNGKNQVKYRKKGRMYKIRETYF